MRPCGSGPLPSIGSPMALMTRPSQPACGCTTGAVFATSALQPRPMPSIDPNGMRRARAVAEADHLAGQAVAIPPDDLAAAADRQAFGHSAELEEHAEHGRDPAITAVLGDPLEIAAEIRQTHRGSGRSFLRWVTGCLSLTHDAVSAAHRAVIFSGSA